MMGFTAINILAGFFASILLLAAMFKIGSRQSETPYLVVLGLPKGMVGRIQTALPVLELCTALWLMSGIANLFSSVAVLAMMTTFAALLAVGTLGGVRAKCGCFGPLDSLPGHWPLIRTACLALLAIPLVWLSAGTAVGLQYPVAWGMLAERGLGALCGLGAVALSILGGEVSTFIRGQPRPPMVVSARENP